MLSVFLHYNFEQSLSLTRFFGKKFEAFALKEFIFGLLPSSQKIGKWWHKEEEIDIVALNEESKEIAFFECKWSGLRKKETEKIFSELKCKAALVKWQNSERKERYGIIARTIEGKEVFRVKGYFAFDLEDWLKHGRFLFR